MNIYEKLLAITSELTRVAKNLQVGEGKFAYKAVGEADILSAVRPLEEKYKVYSYPAKRQVIETGEMETRAGAKNLYLRVETTYKFVNIENPEEYVEITSYGDGVDSQDKAPGKAMTYADKYALMKAYKIMTGDDPDQNASEDLKGVKTAKKAQNSNYTASKSAAGPNTSAAQKPSTGEKMSPEQAAIIETLDIKLKEHACKKYNLAAIQDLSKEQAEYIINSLKEKGVIK